MTTTLVLGGPRSGKSRHAENLLAQHPQVTFVATRSAPDPAADPDLAARIIRHQERRPEGWRTLETLDLTRALMNSRVPVLIDCVGDWVVSVLDEADAWDDPSEARALVDGMLDEVTVALRALPYDVVVVTQDASWAMMPADPRERLLRDLLGHVNQRLSAICGRVHAVVAGRVLDLSSAPAVPSR